MGHKKHKEIDLMDFTDEEYEEWLSCGIDERKTYHRKTIDVFNSTGQYTMLPKEYWKVPYISVA